MFEEIRKALLASFGSIFLTKEKIEEATRRLVEQAKLSRDDAQRLTEELVQTGEKRWSELEKSVTDVVRRGVDNLDVCRASELRSLEVRIDQLEKRIARLETPSSTQDGPQ